MNTKQEGKMTRPEEEHRDRILMPLTIKATDLEGAGLVIEMGMTMILRKTSRSKIQLSYE